MYLYIRRWDRMKEEIGEIEQIILECSLLLIMKVYYILIRLITYIYYYTIIKDKEGL